MQYILYECMYACEQNCTICPAIPITINKLHSAILFSFKQKQMLTTWTKLNLLLIFTLIPEMNHMSKICWCMFPAVNKAASFREVADYSVHYYSPIIILIILTFFMLYIRVSMPIPRSLRIVSFSANFCWLGIIARDILERRLLVISFLVSNNRSLPQHLTAIFVQTHFRSREIISSAPLKRP